MFATLDSRIFRAAVGCAKVANRWSYLSRRSWYGDGAKGIGRRESCSSQAGTFFELLTRTCGQPTFDLTSSNRPLESADHSGPQPTSCFDEADTT